VDFPEPGLPVIRIVGDDVFLIAWRYLLYSFGPNDNDTEQSGDERLFPRLAAAREVWYLQHRAKRDAGPKQERL
jgi:hypothetical protein